METATLSSSSSPHTFDHAMDSAHPSPDFLKMEDFDNNYHPATTDSSTSQTTPPPVVVQSKPAKKRKSWGQQLPEPKTTLPPRKRAKTDDEKEQRRIERIKRNRAAAHNSRERKRQEAEVLAVENAQLRTKLEAFEKHFGPLPKHIVLPEVTLCTDDAATPAPSLIESRGSIATAPSPASPPDLYDLTNNDIAIKQEPHDSPYDDLQHSFDHLDGKQTMPTFAPLDETQHSAAMLCDLPCPSRMAPKVAHSSRTSIPPPTPSPWLLCLATLNSSCLLTYKACLLAMWQARATIRLPSRRVPAATSASAPASTSPSTTSSTPTALPPRMPHPRSTPSATALAQRNAATAAADNGFAVALRRSRPLVGGGSLRRRSVDGDLAAAQSTRETMALDRRDGQQRDQEREKGR